MKIGKCAIVTQGLTGKGWVQQDMFLDLLIPLCFCFRLLHIFLLGYFCCPFSLPSRRLLLLLLPYVDACVQGNYERY